MSLPPDVLKAAKLKPAYGTPCNGCGLCCLMEPCILAVEFIGAETSGRCPALEWDDSEGKGRFWCGLLRAPHRHIAGLEDKPWADGPIQQALRSTGAFDCGCDSEGLD